MGLIKKNWLKEIEKIKHKKQKEEFTRIVERIENEIYDRPSICGIHHLVTYNDSDKELEDKLNKEFLGLIFKVTSKNINTDCSRTIYIEWKADL